MNIIKNFIYLTAICLIFSGVPFGVHAQYDTAYNPGKIVDDYVFTDTSFFKSATDIQRFLESKNSVLAKTDFDFLFMLREPGFDDLKTKLEDPGVGLGRLRTAAELIYDASKSTGLNPQVILVTLQKEQSLITGHQNSSQERLQKALDNALGFDCPDSTGCGDILPGFYSQLFGNVDAEGARYLGATRSLMKSFNTPGGRGPVINGRMAKIGDQITLPATQGPPYNAAREYTFTIANSATAALYRYTPWVFNGNYNFWRYMNEWFKIADGSVVRLTTQEGLYIIQNGARYKLHTAIASLRGLSTTAVRELSESDAQNYPDRGYLAPVDNTVLKSADKYYLVLNNKKYFAPQFVLNNRGISIASPVSLPDDLFAQITDGGVLVPNEGLIVKNKDTGTFLISKGGKMMRFSKLTEEQYRPTESFVEVASVDINLLPMGGFVIPKEGTIVKTKDGALPYLIEAGFKKPITNVVFSNRKFRTKDIKIVLDDEISAYQTGPAVTPAEKTVVKVLPSGDVYWFLNGQKSKVSKFVQKQRRITPDITVKQEANEWQTGLPFPPKNGTFIRGNKSKTVFEIVKGKKKSLSSAEVKKRKIKTNKINILPQAEVDSYISAE